MADYYDIPNDAPKDLKVSELSLHETIPDDPDAAWLLIVVRGLTGRARTLGTRCDRRSCSPIARATPTGTA